VGGTFPNELSRYDAEKNKLGVTVIALAKLRKILGGLSYRVMGVAGDGAVIVEVVDNESGTANEKLTPNGVIIIGGKLKIVGGPALPGVYLVASGSPTITVKVTTGGEQPGQDHRRSAGSSRREVMEGAGTHAVCRQLNLAERSPHHQTDFTLST
jgi:hypothetical protein